MPGTVFAAVRNDLIQIYYHCIRFLIDFMDLSKKMTVKAVIF